MVEKIRNNQTAALMLMCAVLMAILLVLQFTPFWHYGEAGESASISGYVWFPDDYKALDSWLGEQAEGHDLNSFVGTPILLMVLSVLGAVVCLVKPEKSLTALMPTVCGAAVLIAYLTTPVLRLGAGWTWHLLIGTLLLALGIYGLMQRFGKLKN